VPLPICDVTMTRFPLTMGDDTPRPAIGVFQATFSVALHRIGSPVSLVVPVPFGPRQCGQSAAAIVVPAATASRTAHRTAWIMMRTPVAQL
jgi:hypothetical protein